MKSTNRDGQRLRDLVRQTTRVEVGFGDCKLGAADGDGSANGRRGEECLKVKRKAATKLLNEVDGEIKR